MKRKKWTEEEEETLIREYSELASSGVLPKLKTREKKFQPIADRVNSLHHRRDPVAFPFRWSWRDVSIKIQNMRHQYLGVKQKILLPLPSTSTITLDFDWAHGGDHWPNFLLYKQVFGDIDLDPDLTASKSRRKPDLEGDSDGDGEGEDAEEEVDGFIDDDTREDCGGLGLGLGFEWDEDGKMGLPVASRVVELAEAGLRREERTRERDREREEEGEGSKRRKREREHRRTMEELTLERDRRWRLAEEDRKRWRRREERREEEEKEWRERFMGMQMEQEKQVMQMHSDSCLAQMQMIGILVRLVCQFLGTAGGSDAGLGGLPPQVLHNLQQQQHQQEQGSIGGENVKSDTSSAGHYI